MAITGVADPISGTTITTAWAIVNATDPIRDLIARTGAGASLTAGYMLTADGASAASFKDPDGDALLTPGSITGNAAGSAIGTGSIHGNRLIASSVPGSTFTSTAVVDSLGYTPVNRAGDSGLTGALGMTVSPGTNQPLVGLTLQNASGGTSSSLVKLIAGSLATFIGALAGTSSFLVLAADGTTILFQVTSGGHLQVNGQTVWDASNDGSGSGLDADTLDGLDSTAFLKLIGGTLSGDLALSNAFLRLQTSNKGIVLSGGGQVRDNSTTSTDILANGDRLSMYSEDGLTEFLRVTASVLQYLGSAILTAGNVGSTAINFTTAPTISSSQVWTAGNDGSGSGLDADTLDGHDSSYFATENTTVASGTFTGNGSASQSVTVPFSWSTAIVKDLSTFTTFFVTSGLALSNAGFHVTNTGTVANTGDFNGSGNQLNGWSSGGGLGNTSGHVYQYTVFR